MTAEQLLRDPGIYGTSALALLVDRFGPECISWEPATIGLEIKSEYGFEPSAALQDRVQAAMSLFTSNLFFVSLEAFSAVSNALNFGTVSGSMFLPADLDDALWGVTEAHLLLGADYQPDMFSSNVALYVGVLLEQEGVDHPPPILQFAEYPKRDVSSGVAGADNILSSDPALFKAHFDEEQAQKNGLERQNHLKLLTLLHQLSELPLRTGDVSWLRTRLKQAPEAVAAP